MADLRLMAQQRKQQRKQRKQRQERQQQQQQRKKQQRKQPSLHCRRGRVFRLQKRPRLPHHERPSPLLLLPLQGPGLPDGGVREHGRQPRGGSE